VGEILAPALARSGYLEIAQRCQSLRTPTELVAIARCLRGRDASALHRPLTSALEHAADAGRHWLSGLPSEVVFCTFSAIREIASLEGDRLVERVYRQAASILDAATAIGKQAGAAGMDVVAKRMTAAKQTSPEAAHRGEVLAA